MKMRNSRHLLKQAMEVPPKRWHPAVKQAHKEWVKLIKRDVPCRQLFIDVPRLSCGVLLKVMDIDGLKVQLTHECVAVEEAGEVCDVCNFGHKPLPEPRDMELRLASVDGIERAQHEEWWKRAKDRIVVQTSCQDRPHIHVTSLYLDQYGRTVGTCVLKVADEPFHLIQWLVQEGLVFVVPSYCIDHKLYKIEKQAMEAARQALQREGFPEDDLDAALASNIVNIHVAPMFEKPWVYKSRQA
jgi:endonuclease YncB( thermonuclease family)